MRHSTAQQAHSYAIHTISITSSSTQQQLRTKRTDSQSTPGAPEPLRESAIRTDYGRRIGSHQTQVDRTQAERTRRTRRKVLPKGLLLLDYAQAYGRPKTTAYRRGA